MKKKLSMLLAVVVTCVMIFGSSLSVLGAATTDAKTGDVKTVWWYVFLFGAASVIVVMNVRRKNCKK